MKVYSLYLIILNEKRDYDIYEKVNIDTYICNNYTNL